MSLDAMNLKMPDINSVTIAGNLTGDPTLRRTTNGTPVANFNIASNRKFKDNTGSWRENVCFVGVVAWYKLAENCSKFLSKGSAILVEGELQSRSWRSDNGSHNSVVEIKARRVQFLNRSRQSAKAVMLENDTDESDDYFGHSDDSSISRRQDVEIVDNNRHLSHDPDSSDFSFEYGNNNYETKE